MTCALVLARSGRRVALVEKAGRTAPLIRGFSRGGVHFDTGFHYTGGLNEGGALDLVFRYLGLSDHVTSYPFDEEGFDVFRSVREGFEFRFPSGYGPIRERLAGAFPAERSAVDAYLRAVRAEFDSAPYLNPGVPFDGTSAFRKIFGPTLKETLDTLTGDELLKSVLSMHCLLYGVPPAEVSFHQHACIVGGYYLSARGIRGGGGSLAAAFDARLERMGVDVLCGSGVERIEAVEEDRLAVRLENGTGLRCGGVVATVHPRSLMEMLPEAALRPADRKRIAGLEDTLPAYLLFAFSDAPLPSVQGRNLFVFPDSVAATTLGNPTLEGNPLYVTAAYGDERGAPRGFVGIVPSTAEPEETPQFKRETVAKLEGIVRMLCPELGGALGHTEGATPTTLRRFNHSPSGGLYGVKHKVGQRNPGPLTRMKGVYLAGQAVTAPGVLGAALSAFVTCGTILGHDRIMKELMECR
jgi:all-trans-retinol 13,14-reductase